MQIFRLTSEIIDETALKLGLQNCRAGALAVFEGWVRDHNQGKQVSALEYQVYETLAQKEGDKIISEAKAKYNLHGIQCVHRYGFLRLGECAVWIGATATHRDDAFKAARYVIDEIKHRLPIWKKEHYIGEAPEWVFCRDHHSHVHFHEADYYKKQASLVDQTLLKRARVLVVGAGGLGCPVLQSLASAGVGTIGIVDFDTIEISNLHRQTLYAASLVGEKKAVIAAARLADLNPFIKILTIDVRIDAKNVKSVLNGYDLVLDCTDNFKTKFLLNDACFAANTPFVSASIYKHEGTLRTFVPGSKHGCMRCHLQDGDVEAQVGNCNDFGVLGASVSVLGAMQASEAIRFLLEKTNATLKETHFLDVRHLSFMRIRNTVQFGCRSCQGLATFNSCNYEIAANELGNDCELIDIRDKDDSVLEQYKGHSGKVVIMCHRGNRSLSLTKQYRARGYSQFFSLTGGACSL